MISDEQKLAMAMFEARRLGLIVPPPGVILWVCSDYSFRTVCGRHAFAHRSVHQHAVIKPLTELEAYEPRRLTGIEKMELEGGL